MSDIKCIEIEREVGPREASVPRDPNYRPLRQNGRQPKNQNILQNDFLLEKVFCH